MPELNPALKSFVSDGVANMKAQLQSITNKTKPGAFKIWSFLLILVLGVVAIAVHLGKFRPFYETPSNIRRVTANRAREADKTASKSPRQGLPDYLGTLTSVPAAEQILGNFQICTVNGAGLFSPAEDGVFSTDAVKSVVEAGARACVLEIWPDLRPGQNFAPVLQVVENGSTWRRISLNSAPFQTLLRTWVSNVFNPGLGPTSLGNQDVVLIYLRFCGTPRPSTFAGVAAAFQEFEQYRLDTSFHACRGQSRLALIPMQELGQKMIVFSSHKAEGTPLESFINAAPQDGIPVELPLESIKNGAVNRDILRKNIVFVAPPLNEERTTNNAWDWMTARNVGIQCVAMNLLGKASPALDAYRAYFTPSSYKIKAAELRLVPIETAPTREPVRPTPIEIPEPMKQL